MEDDEIGRYRPIQPKQFPPKPHKKSAEEKYWRRFKAPVAVQEFGAVTNIDFSAEKPHHFAVTAATRVNVYDSKTREVRRTFARFKDKAYSGCFRDDGKLMVAGGEDGVVQVFEADGRTLLRQLKGHQKPVRVARFSPDKVHVLSAGDDTTVRYWDITSGEQIHRLTGHSDYVRAADVSPVDANSWATGGYDHSCKLWDVETGEERLSLDHGSPVEAVKFVPSGAMLITAGGTEVRVWNILGGAARLAAKLTNFQKTVTCLCLTPLAGPDSQASARLLAGSLDGHVKVYDLASFQLKHASKYPGPILSLGLSPDCRTLAVGLADGTLSVRRHTRKRQPGVAEGEGVRRPAKPRLDAGNYRYFVRGASEKPSPGDLVVQEQKRQKLKEYDWLLKKFQHRDALDAALSTHDPTQVVAVVEELNRRKGGLNSAIGGRDDAGMTLLLQFICKYVQDMRYSKLMTQISECILDIYGADMAQSPAICKEFQRLKQKLRDEEALQLKLMRVQGSLEPILAAVMTR